MVAYSFQPEFRAPILAGVKRQTIRAFRKRHAEPGEQLQLFTAMRTRHCRLIGRAACIGSEPISIDVLRWQIELGAEQLGERAAEILARDDGFNSPAAMQAFWRHHHPGIAHFSGVLVRWRDLRPELAATAAVRRA